MSYLASVSALLDSQEKMGLQRSQTLANEFQLHWNELKDLLQKEHENARKSE